MSSCLWCLPINTSASQNVLDADPRGFPEAFLEQQPLRVVYPMKTATEHVSDAPNLASQPYFALKSPGVKWANERRTHGYAFAPSHYGAVDGSHIKWERTGFSAYQRNRCYDLFCREQDKWFYSGVYEVVGLRSMPMDQFRAQNPDMVDGIICNTAAFEGRLSELVTGFYEQGLLEVECIAIRRVKFKRSVYESMVERRKGLEARARGARIASDVRRQGEGTKRGLEQPDEGEPTENNAPTKKAKTGSLPALVDDNGGQAFRGTRTRRGSLVIYEGSRSRR
ncbi:hypothetical protein OE88DRAFT_1650966 [Heliocybe sulcata]|uniref:Uncharacterized protein n=1 Tax=Heliocybe sulcata TaxID=5364 RepID=A0A5C3NKB5_9AGAM|nr:hypothetical protein OE88DRAFT_1650966 [Heliocybe sulcata]